MRFTSFIATTNVCDRLGLQVLIRLKASPTTNSFLMKTITSKESDSSRAVATSAGQNARSLPAQFAIKAGLIPHAPDNHRLVTTGLSVNANLGSLDGNKAFNNTQRAAIVNHNDAQVPMLTTSNEDRPLKDDVDTTALLHPQRSKQLAPEIDHVVPRAQHGANDVRNARVVSKDNNLNAGNRPDEDNSNVAVYEPVTVFGTTYPAGAELSDQHANGVRNYYGVADKYAMVATLRQDTPLNVSQGTGNLEMMDVD